MALLPLAGFAADPVVGFGDGNASRSKTYDGSSHDLPAPTTINGTAIPNTTNILELKWYYVDGTTETEITKNAAGKYQYKDAGTYKVTFDLNEELGTGTTHYTATWLVKQKQVTVSAELKSGNTITYGDAYDATKFKAKYDGFVGTDLASGNPKAGVMSGSVTEFLTDYTQGANAGTDAYYIRPIITSLTSKNYTFVVAATDAKFSVKAKAIVDDASKFTFSFSELVYNAMNQMPTITVKDLALDKEATFTAEFFTKSECASTDAFTYDQYAFTAYSAADGGTQYATGTVEVLSETSNYAIVKVKDNTVTSWIGKIFKVNKVANATRYQLYENEAPINVWVELGTKTAAATLNHKDADIYYVKITGSGNYGGTAIKKSFKIQQKPLAITTSNQKIEYTGEVLTLDNTKITYEGLEDADKATGQEIPATTGVFEDNISIKVKTTKPITFVGTGADYVIQAYAVKTTGSGANEVTENINDVTKIFKNYQVAYFNDGILTVTPKELTFNLKAQEVQYGNESNLMPGASYTPTTDFADYLTVTGFVNGDAVVAYPKLTVADKEIAANSSQYTITADLTTVALKHTDAEGVETVVLFNNYKLSATSNTTSVLSLIKGNISVRPINNGVTYGDAQAALTVNVSTANANDKATAANVLKEAVVIAATANDGTTKYPNVGKYVMSLDLTKVKDNADYQALIKNYNISTFTGEYTISKRDLTKITIADQTVAINSSTTASSNTDLDEDLVVFEAGNYKLTDYDKAILKEEFEYVFKNEVSTAAITATPITDAIRIKFATGVTAFKNFNLPEGVTLGAAGNKVKDKYILGALTVAQTAAGAIVLNPVNKATWTAVDDGVKTAAQVLAARQAYGYTAIKDANGKIATVKFGNFAMVAERWYTMVLPFNTTVAEISQALGYAVVNVLNKDNATDDVKFKLYMQEIPANEPFLVKVYKNINLGDQDMNGTENDPVTFTAKNIVFTATPSVEDEAGNQFIGTFMGYQTADDVDDEYYMATSNGGWYQHGYTRPSGAYLKVVAAQSARIFVEEPDGSTTAIELINGEAVPAAEGWYTLNGVKLQGVPTEKGVYINNGKKVVIK